jgi:hypothetical protein
VTEQRLAKLLIEGPESSNLGKKVQTYLNRLLLRIFSVPALQNFLVDVRQISDDESGDGAVKIQLDFMRLPEEIRPELERLLAAPRDPRFLKYVKDGEARTGVEVEIRPDDLEGSAYDYAF